MVLSVLRKDADMLFFLVYCVVCVIYFDGLSVGGFRWFQNLSGAVWHAHFEISSLFAFLSLEGAM